MKLWVSLGFAICHQCFAQIATSTLALNSPYDFHNQSGYSGQPLDFSETKQWFISSSTQNLVTGTDLFNQQFSAQFQNPNHSFHLRYNQFGSPDLHSKNLFIFSGIKLNKLTSAGVGVEAVQQIPSESSRLQLLLHTGLRYQISNNSELYYHGIWNSNSTHHFSYRIQLSKPMSVIAGLCTNYETTFLQIGTVYCLRDGYVISANTSSGGQWFQFGCLKKAKFYQIGLNLGFINQNLGYRPTLHLIINLNEHQTWNSRSDLDDVHQRTGTN